nr:hypothetical protein CFP56_78433 [Quercus suber]
MLALARLASRLARWTSLGHWQLLSPLRPGSTTTIHLLMATLCNNIERSSELLEASRNGTSTSPDLPWDVCPDAHVYGRGMRRSSYDLDSVESVRPNITQVARYMDRTDE